jgi:hypothetical protein
MPQFLISSIPTRILLSLLLRPTLILSNDPRFILPSGLFPLVWISILSACYMPHESHFPWCCDRRGEFVPVRAEEAFGGAEVQLHSFLTSAVDGGELWTPRFGGRFTTWEEPWCPTNRRLGGLRDLSGRFGEEKNLVPLPGVEPEVQVVKLAIMQFSPFPYYLSLRPENLPLHLVLWHPPVMFLLSATHQVSHPYRRQAKLQFCIL